MQPGSYNRVMRDSYTGPTMTLGNMRAFRHHID
jgi:hypothetical protein